MAERRTGIAWLGPIVLLLIGLAGIASPSVLGLESMAYAGPPPRAGPRSRGPAWRQDPPSSNQPETLPSAPSSAPGPAMAGEETDHAAHHPEGGPGGGGPGGGPGGGGPRGGPGGGPDQSREFLPSTTLPRLLSGQPLSPATRQLLDIRAEENISEGRSEIVSGLRRLADARVDDLDELETSVTRLRAGARKISKGLALRRSLAEPELATDSALQWIREDLGLRQPTEEHDPSSGLGLFHAGIMAILSAFAAAMLWMYFFKMRRAAALLQTLESVVPPPGRRVAEPPQRATTWRGELMIAAVFQETDTVKTFRFCEAEGKSIPFIYLPGQFLTLKVAPQGKTLQRSYTIASSPTQRDYVEITVKREDRGAVSRFLHDQMSEGDTISVSAPAGRLTFTGQEADAIVLFAGGVGITPMMSVVRYLTDRAWRGATHLLVSCKREADIIFARELASIAERHENFHLNVILSSPEEGWTGRRGRLTREMIADLVPDVAKHRAHLCGPPPMMDAVTAMLLELGVPSTQIFTEKFGQTRRTKPPAPRVSAAKADTPARAKHLPLVSFRASGKKAPLGPEVTILEAAESVGVEIDNSCRVGTCGTCMVRLLEGEVTMAVEDGLHPDDKADGFILACQACAKSDIVVDG